MAMLLKLLAKYIAAVCLFGLAYLTLISDPSEPLLAKFPIVPGIYQHEIAAGFEAVGLALAGVVYAYEKRKAAGPTKRGA